MQACDRSDLEMGPSSPPSFPLNRGFNSRTWTGD